MNLLASSVKPSPTIHYPSSPPPDFTLCVLSCPQAPVTIMNYSFNTLSKHAVGTIKYNILWTPIRYRLNHTIYMFLKKPMTQDHHHGRVLKKRSEFTGICCLTQSVNHSITAQSEQIIKHPLGITVPYTLTCLSLGGCFFSSETILLYVSV